MDNSFKKTERLNSQLVIDKLFAGGNASMAVFPLRAVFMKVPFSEDDSNKNLPPGFDCTDELGRKNRIF